MDKKGRISARTIILTTSYTPTMTVIEPAGIHCILFGKNSQYPISSDGNDFKLPVNGRCIKEIKLVT